MDTNTRLDALEKAVAALAEKLAPIVELAAPALEDKKAREAAGEQPPTDEGTV